MFTAKELKNIDTRYFSVIASGECTLTLQSKNTGHCWHILLQEYPHFRSCLIYHTHHRGTPYHEHGHGATLSGCLSQIRNHDACWLSRKSRLKPHKEVRHEAEKHQSSIHQP